MDLADCVEFTNTQIWARVNKSLGATFPEEWEYNLRVPLASGQGTVECKLHPTGVRQEQERPVRSLQSQREAQDEGS